MRRRFTRLQSNAPICDPAQGWPSMQFQRYWQTFCESLENVLTDIEAVNEAQQVALEAIIANQQATDAAQGTADNAVDAAGGAQGTADAALALAGDAQATATGAQSTAAAAGEAAGDANEAIAQIGAGDFPVEAITIGGQRFVNNGGVLEVEP